MTTLLGNVIDYRYELLAQIGSGGMGTVYKAKQHPFEREVALKMLNGNMPDDPEALARFEREALAISKLKHKNIVMFYGYGIFRTAPYMVMEYIHGHSLQDALSSGTPLEAPYAMRVAEQIGEALSCAHANGLVHRDLKPSNVMIADDDSALSVKIIDFGLARLLPSFGKELQKLTEAGSAIGSVLYMSPEQCTGLPTDARSDIYALGCIMHHCLTGSPPFEGDHSVVVMRYHIEQLAPRLNTMNADASANLQFIVDRAMSKDPADRYQTADEMLHDVRAYLNGREIAAETKEVSQTSIVRAVQPDAPTNKSARMRILSVAAVIAAISATGYFLTEQHQLEEHGNPAWTDSVWVLRRQADIAWKRGNVDESARLFEVLVQRNDTHPLLNLEECDNASLQLATCYLQLHKYNELRDLVRMQLTPKRRRLLGTALGSLMVQKYLVADDEIGNENDAIVFLSDAVETLKNDHMQGWQTYARWLITRLSGSGRHAEAISVAEELIPSVEDEGTRIVLMAVEGKALAAAGRNTESEQVMKDVVKLARKNDFTSTIVMHSTAMALMKLGRYREARQMLEEALGSRDTSISVRPTLAECAAQQGDYSTAFKALRETLDGAKEQDSLSRRQTEQGVAAATIQVMQIAKRGLSPDLFDKFDKLRLEAEGKMTVPPERHRQ